MNVTEDQHASYKLLSRELEKRGFIFHAFELAGEQVMSLMSPTGKRWVTPLGKISYPMNTGFHTAVARSKHISYEFAKYHGFSIAQTRVIDDQQKLSTREAAEIIQQCGGRVVVKPESASLSRGLTRDVTTVDQLMAAIEYAKDAIRASSKILIQQQITGEEVRFMVVAGKVVGAILREKPSLIGDGISSIATLIERENDARRALRETMVSYPMLTQEMFDDELSMDRVLSDGERLELSKATMIKDGASMRDVMGSIHPSYVHAVEELVKNLGAGFIAADIFIEDYMQPMTSGNTFFNEFNGAPVLKLCYSCRDGKHIDIVPILADAIEKRIHA